MTDPYLNEVPTSLLSHYTHNVVIPEIASIGTLYDSSGVDLGLRAWFTGYNLLEQEIFHEVISYEQSIALASLLKARLPRQVAAALVHQGYVSAQRAERKCGSILKTPVRVADILSLPDGSCWEISCVSDMNTELLDRLAFCGDYSVVGMRKGKALRLESAANINQLLQPVRSLRGRMREERVQ